MLAAKKYYSNKEKIIITLFILILSKYSEPFVAYLTYKYCDIVLVLMESIEVIFSLYIIIRIILFICL